MTSITIDDAVTRLRSGRKVILVHGNADCDAIGSAYALARTFGNADIFTPSGMDRVARTVVEKLNIETIEECDVSSYDLVVAVDTSSPELFQNDKTTIPPGNLVIDHHMPTGKWDEMDFLCDSTRTSCCEIVMDIIDAAGLEIDKKTGLVLLSGMLTDSGHFQYADPRMLRAFGKIMESCAIPMDEAMQIVRLPVSMSERTSSMKAASRSRFDRVGDMIVAVSKGSSYEAASCRALMCVGADVVYVGSQRDDDFRISARATQEAVRRGIHLDQMMDIISNETENDGGGHEGAAGMTGTGDVEAMLNICLMRTMDVFRKIKKEKDAEKLTGAS